MKRSRVSGVSPRDGRGLQRQHAAVLRLHPIERLRTAVQRFEDLVRPDLIHRISFLVFQQDGGDVIRSTVVVGAVDQAAPPCPAELAAPPRISRNRRVVHRTVQAVGAQQHLVAGSSRSTCVRIRTCSNVPTAIVRTLRFGMRAHALLAEAELVRSSLREVLVVGELPQLAGAKQVRAAVADVGDDHLRQPPQRQHHGGAHAVALGAHGARRPAPGD